MDIMTPAPLTPAHPGADTGCVAVNPATRFGDLELKGGQPPHHAVFLRPFRLAMPPVSAGRVGRPSGLPVRL